MSSRSSAASSLPLTDVGAGAGAGAAPRQSIWPLVTVAFGFVMAMLDVTVVNVALTQIQSSLSVALTGLVWIVDGYTLTFAALLLIGGALANRYGARNVYRAGLVLFVAASLLCGAAPTGGALVAARLLQGVGAALFMPSSLSLLSQAYPDNTVRIKMLGLWSAIVSAAGAMGPVVGGVLVGSLGWRSIFFLNVPIGIVGLLLMHRTIAQSPRRAQALNLAGHAVGVIALAALSFALIEGAALGWTSAPILGAAVLTVAAGAIFVRRERRSASPIVSRELFDHAQFPAANGIGFLINVGAYGEFFLISLYLQQTHGFTAWHTGLALLPLMVMFTLGSLLSPRITARWGARFSMAAGLTVAGLISSGLVIGLRTDTPYAVVALAVGASFLGVSIAVPAMTAVVMQVAGQSHANIAAAALNANRQIGVLIGVAAMGAVLHMSAGWNTAAPVSFAIISTGYLAALALVWRYIRRHA